MAQYTLQQFFAANDAFFHGLVFGLERSREEGGSYRFVTCIGTGKEWEKVECFVECAGGCWIHLATTIEATGRIAEYYNGQQIMSEIVKKPIAIVPGTHLSLMFGHDPSLAENRTYTDLGHLGGFEIYDFAMTPGEVKALYSGGRKDSKPTVKPSWFLVWSWVLMIGAGAVAITLSMRSWTKKLREIPSPVSSHLRRVRSPY